MNMASSEKHSESFELAERLLLVLDVIVKVTEYRMPDDITNSLRMNQIRALYLLKYAPGISQKDLAEQLNITPAAVSITVRDMEKLNLVERQPDPADARQVKLYLSAYGKDMLAQGEEMRCNAVAKMLSVLPIEEQRAIVETLERALEMTQNGHGQ
jgi:DNA-binding MarR family transcriptional regulator